MLARPQSAPLSDAPTRLALSALAPVREAPARSAWQCFNQCLYSAFTCCINVIQTYSLQCSAKVCALLVFQHIQSLHSEANLSAP